MRTKSQPRLILVIGFMIASSFMLGLPRLAEAEKVCLKSTINRAGAVKHKRKLIPSGSRCPRGSVELIDTNTLVGPSGTNGANGADGALRIYGDGSAGDLVIATNTDWEASPPSNGNLQFTSLTVDSGKTLTIPSGMIIRVTGTFTNNGVIEVSHAAGVGAVSCNGSCGINGKEQARMSAHPGITSAVASCGLVGNNTLQLLAGPSAPGLEEAVARSIVKPGLYGGGGGMQEGLYFSFAAGGGTVVVLAQSGVVNTGTIRANGSAQGLAGSSGGGGGIIILASQSSVNNSGTLEAKGGNGVGAGTRVGPGGGGGGGIVHLVAPSVVNTGTTTVSGGSGVSASAAGTVTISTRMGGCSGGASGGASGAGGVVNSDGSTFSSGTGSSGYVFESILDPTALF